MQKRAGRMRARQSVAPVAPPPPGPATAATSAPAGAGPRREHVAAVRRIDGVWIAGVFAAIRRIAGIFAGAAAKVGSDEGYDARARRRGGSRARREDHGERVAVGAFGRGELLDPGTAWGLQGLTQGRSESACSTNLFNEPSVPCRKPRTRTARRANSLKVRCGFDMLDEFGGRAP